MAAYEKESAKHERSGDSNSISSLMLRGLFNSNIEECSSFTPRGTLAFVTAVEGELPSQKEFSVTRTFFDQNSEILFLSRCAHGNENLPGLSNPPATDEEWRSVKYVSQVKHTWFFCKKFNLKNDEIQLSGEAVESLQNISKCLKAEKASQSDASSQLIEQFFKEFGSHMSTGPFFEGGRLIQKAVASEFAVADGPQVLTEVELAFTNINPEDVDLSSSGGDSHILSLRGDEPSSELIEISRQVLLFGGKANESDLKKWEQSLPDSDLVISGAVSIENAMPVWEILRYQDCFAEVDRELLARVLETTWEQLSSANQTPGIGSTSKDSGDEYETASENDDDDDDSAKHTVPLDLRMKLNLDGEIHGPCDSTLLRKTASADSDGGANVMWSFLRAITSLDYRGRKCIRLQNIQTDSANSVRRDTGADIFEDDDTNETEPDKSISIVSSMDVTMAVLHSCDPFLRQELLWKMAECRLAVPVLLSDFRNKAPVEFQLWGLRKIYKSWIPRNKTTPIEKSVVSCPMPIVSFLRLGSVSFSKSKLLNKILGKLQGNNDHSFFVDAEDEPPCAKWSKGNIEAAWFLPDSVRDDENESALPDAVAFLNLRGDALQFPVQKQFACKASDVVVLLVESKNYKECLPEIKAISQEMARNVLCMICTSDTSKGSTIKRQGNFTKMFSKPFLADVGADICSEIKQRLWSDDEQCSEPQAFRSMESLCDLKKDIHFNIDEQREDCLVAKKLAHDIVEHVRESPETYKVSELPLQGDLWKKWADLDKNWNRGYRPGKQFRTIEHYHDDLKDKMRNVRSEQVASEPSDDIVKFTEALKRTSDSRWFFVEWFNFYLNDLSQEKLGPLREELRLIQSKARDINSEKSRLNTQPDKSQEDNKNLERLIEEDKQLLLRAQDITREIDDGSVGMEHFIRELGQRFEAYDETKGSGQDTDVDTRINLETLPDVAADLLINGYPLEILDGEVGRVPIKWVQAVLTSAIRKIGNARVCAISVLGIQSSGKSTLLNSMFGVRFAVSAGRCTRGVFIQLLRVHEDLHNETQCEYVIVIDTEGLKAPERSLRDDFRHDNELATFALCLADLTIVNIAGQTVGKDMTDVLQIAAHAFIRMKEVHIKSSCRIIQQFVADLAAADKNEACTQAIFNSLDESIAAAGKDEGYSEMYTRFSDVFNLKQNKDVQYIPSLWQGSMAPPNHRYSEKILKLKNIIIQDLKMSGRSMTDFIERTSAVWNAVKEENFIFSFQNCVIALRYKTFQHAYGKWVGEMRQAMMEWESDAKHTLMTAKREEVDGIKAKLKTEISAVVEREGAKVEEHILEYLRENIKDDDDQLHKFEGEFLQDLDLNKRNFEQDAKDSLDRVADSIKQLNHMDVLLPRCKNQLRERARKQAIELREENKDAPTLDEVMSDEAIDAKFDKLWDGWIKEICDTYPPRQVTREDVENEFGFYACHQGQKKDISKGLKERLGIPRSKAHRVVAYIQQLPSSIKSGNQDDVVAQIIENSLASLQIDLSKELAFDPIIIKKLVDTTIDALNSKYRGTTLTQEMKVNTIVEVCERAIPMILEGRIEYNNKYSLRQRLMKEKESLRKDFRALCSNAFQDKRASENITSLLEEKVAEVVLNYLGPAIYKAARERCPYFVSKFALFGQVLEDMAVEEDPHSYYRFVFELGNFLEDWSLGRIADMCVKPTATNSGNESYIESVAHGKIVNIVDGLLDSVKSTTAMWTENKLKDSRVRFSDWITHLRTKISRDNTGLQLSDEDVWNLFMFNVKDTAFFGDQVTEYIKDFMARNVLEILDLPSVNEKDKAEVMLRSLPTKPHQEIKRHVSGCMEQCPICHVPCDNMTKQHDKHRAELHYPEGVVGCATAMDERLTCNICTSSVTTDDSYWDGQVRRKYANYQHDFPNWVIQPIQNDTPMNYWKWVLNRFNEDFARLYGREEADLPRGWQEITRRQALDDLREAYVTKASST